MDSDERIDWVEREDIDGLDELREDRPEEFAMLGERAAVVGWFRALQETCFREEWLAEGGMFGEKGSSGPPPEDVGPMDEVM
jgi:hypothetical protein